MREKLIELLCNIPVEKEVLNGDLFEKVAYIADHLIANGVTIPVYCKDCKHFDMENMECHCDEVSTDNEGGADYSLNFYLDDFCSYGERRTDGTTDHDL